ncbi:MAG: serine acetyltransferase [Pseudomonadota bacterium]
MKDLIKQDMKAAGLDANSFAAIAKAYLTRPDFKLGVLYRIYSHWFNKSRFKHFIAGILWRHAIRCSGCYISPLSKIKGGLKLCHATGIVVGRGVRLGENATLYQHVTLGQKDEADEQFPICGDNVTLYAGACVLGGIKIGDGAIVGANAVVLQDVPENTKAVGAPARILKN